MRLRDDQAPDQAAPVEITKANLRDAKQAIKAFVRSVGGEAELQDVIEHFRKNGAEPFWKNMTNSHFEDLAKEAQAEWDARRAERAANRGF